MKRVASALAILVALASTAYADGVMGAYDGLATLVVGVVIAIGLLIVLLVIFGLGKSYSRKQDEGWKRRHHPSEVDDEQAELPPARVVDSHD